MGRQADVGVAELQAARVERAIDQYVLRLAVGRRPALVVTAFMRSWPALVVTAFMRSWPDPINRVTTSARVCDPPL